MVPGAFALAVAVLVGFLDTAEVLLAFALVVAALVDFSEAARAFDTFCAVFFIVDRDLGAAFVTPFLPVVFSDFCDLVVVDFVAFFAAAGVLGVFVSVFSGALALVAGFVVGFLDVAKALVTFSAVFLVVARDFGVALVTPFLRVVVVVFVRVVPFAAVEGFLTGACLTGAFTAVAVAVRAMMSW